MCPSDPSPCTLPVGSLIVIRGQDPHSIQAGPACDLPAVGPSAPVGTLGSIIVLRPYLDNLDYIVVHRDRQVTIIQDSRLAFKNQGDANAGCDPRLYTSE